MTLGDLIDSLITINLKIKNKTNQEEIDILIKQRDFVVNNINKYIEVSLIIAPPDLSKMKIYKNQPDITIGETLGESIYFLIDVVSRLWDWQNQINMELYKSGEQNAINYVDGLHLLNSERNARIDDVNQKFRQTLLNE